MSLTRGDVVRAALNELGIADYEFDITPEELSSGVRRLNAMMAYWSDVGIRIPYNKGTGLQDQTNIPDIAEEGVITNLATKLAASYGKQVGPEVKISAKMAMTILQGHYAKQVLSQLPSMPKGAGFKSIDEPFSPEPRDRFFSDVDETPDRGREPERQ